MWKSFLACIFSGFQCRPVWGRTPTYVNGSVFRYNLETLIICQKIKIKLLGDINCQKIEMKFEDINCWKIKMNSQDPLMRRIDGSHMIPPSAVVPIFHLTHKWPKPIFQNKIYQNHLKPSLQLVASNIPKQK